jgi:hypothetical protein
VRIIADLCCGKKTCPKIWEHGSLILIQGDLYDGTVDDVRREVIVSIPREVMMEAAKELTRSTIHRIYPESAYEMNLDEAALYDEDHRSGV